MTSVVEWLESPSGEHWSQMEHEKLKHHALIEDWDILSECELGLNDWFEEHPDTPYQEFMVNHSGCHEGSPGAVGAAMNGVFIVRWNPDFHMPIARDIIYSQEYRHE